YTTLFRSPFPLTPPLLRRSHTQNFLHRRDTQPHQPPPIFRQRAHAGAAGSVADDIARNIFQDQLANFIIRIHPFKNRMPPMESRLTAFATANRPINRGVRWDADLLLECLSRRRMVFLFAVFAEHADQSLSEYRFQ